MNEHSEYIPPEAETPIQPVEAANQPSEAIQSDSLNTNENDSRAPEFDRQKTLEGLADQLLDFSLRVEPTDTVLLRVDDTALELVEIVTRNIQERGAQVLVTIADQAEDENMLAELTRKIKREMLAQAVRAMMEGKSGQTPQFPDTTAKEAPEEQVRFMHHGPGTEAVDMLIQANKVLTIASRKSFGEGEFDVDTRLRREWAKIIRITTDIRVKEKGWLLFRPPTKEDAKASNVDWNVYEQKFFKACDRDWKKVEEAQDHLIEHLAQGKILEMVVPAPQGMSEIWNTHISMDISGMRGSNSTARANMPGSEVYVAPNIFTNPETGEREGTLNGRVAIPNRVMIENLIIPSLILDIQKGKVVSFEIHALQGESDEEIAYARAHMQRLLDTDAGASWIGELGIGTNPELDFPVTNTLLNEKILGFHIALGKAYENAVREGRTVITDNGNRSSIHIDIARVMTPKYGGGQMILDGVPFFDNGRFLDNKLAYLNPESTKVQTPTEDQ